MAEEVTPIPLMVTVELLLKCVLSPVMTTGTLNPCLPELGVTEEIDGGSSAWNVPIAILVVESMLSVTDVVTRCEPRKAVVKDIFNAS